MLSHAALHAPILRLAACLTMTLHAVALGHALLPHLPHHLRLGISTLLSITWRIHVSMRAKTRTAMIAWRQLPAVAKMVFVLELCQSRRSLPCFMLHSRKRFS